MKLVFILVSALSVQLFSAAPVWEKKFQGRVLLDGGQPYFQRTVPLSSNMWGLGVGVFDLDQLKSGISKYYAVEMDSVTYAVYKIENGELEVSFHVPYPRVPLQFAISVYSSNFVPAQLALIKGFTKNGWASVTRLSDPNSESSQNGPLVVSDPSGGEILKIDSVYRASLHYSGTSSSIIAETRTDDGITTRVYKLADGLAINNSVRPKNLHIAKNSAVRKVSYTTNGRIAKQAARVIKAYVK